jgi:hypothetical protein
MIVLVALIVAAFVALNWGFFAQLFALMQQGMSAQMPDEQAAVFAMRLMTLFFSVFLFLFPLYMVLAAYEAACLRWMIRGEVPGLFGLTLDHDMWRVYGIYWCWFILNFAVSFAVSVVTMPFLFMTMGDIMNDPSPEAMWAWQWRVQIPLSLLQYIPLIFLSVRFAPGAATSIARKRFSFLDAWTVTRGRFWELLGSFALLWFIIALLWIVPSAISFFLDFGGSWEAYSRVWTEPPTEEWVEEQLREAWEQLSTPTGLAVLAANLALSLGAALALAVMTFGVNARAAMGALEEGKISVHTETA